MKNLLFILFGLIAINAVCQTEVNRNAVDPNLAPFYHGVASGDPKPNGVIIWTRYTPDFFVEETFPIHYRVASDSGMTTLVDTGTVMAKSTDDFTVKLQLATLEPNTFYYYDFRHDSTFSIRGRTKTAPSPESHEDIRFGLVSCSNYEYGYFTAYGNLAERNDVDAILHLGDYIYEYEVGGYSANIPGRDHEPATEIITLDDYRLRYSHYRLDPDLMRLHQYYPFINVWDDHETADNSWKNGAVNHDESTEGSWFSRKQNGIKAFAEWIPSELDPNDGIIYRQFQFGKNISLHMLDTRLIGRDEQAETGSPEIFLPGRSLLGADQFSWLKNGLKAQKQGWNIIGQQVMMAPLTLGGVPINPDQWDGYQEERNNLYSFLEEENLNNMVVLTGDIHTSWANDLPKVGYDALTQSNSAGVEFVCTSITSPGLDLGDQNINDLTPEVLKVNNPHMKYIDLLKKGYMILDVRQDRVQGEWWYVNSINTPTSDDYYAESYFVQKGTSILSQGIGPSQRRTYMDPIPPVNPWKPSLEEEEEEEKEEEEEDGNEGNEEGQNGEEEEEGEEVGVSDSHPFILFGLYPNPAEDKVILQFQNKGSLDLHFYDTRGRLILSKTMHTHLGIHYLELGIQDWDPGIYILEVSNVHGRKQVARLVKR